MNLDLTYAALGDPSRRAILRRLARQDGLSISELAEPLSIALPTVMKHLDVLTRAGLISRRKTGRVVRVTLKPKAMDEAMAWLAQTDAFWSKQLDRLTRFVEEEGGR